MRANQVILLLAMLLLGGSLRLTGLNWGFPQFLNMDENVPIINSYNLATTNTWEPDYYDHPEQITIYINTILFKLLHCLTNNKVTPHSNPYIYYLIARAVTAVFGFLSIFLAYKIGRLFSVTCGLLMASVLAIFPSFIEHAHYATSDVPMTFFVLGVILFSIKYLDAPHVKYVIWASLFAAWATAQKYPGILSLSIIMGSIIIGSLKSKTKDSLQSPANQVLRMSLCVAGVFSLGIMVFAPFLIINYQKVYAALFLQASAGHLGADNLRFLEKIAFYISHFVTQSGIVLSLMSLIGAIFIIKRERWRSLPLFLGLIYLLALSCTVKHWERWALPMYFTPIFTASYALSYLFESKRSSPVALVVTIIVLTNLTLGGLHRYALLTGQWTHNISFQYCQDNRITVENTLFEGGTPLQTYFDDWEQNQFFQNVANRLNQPNEKAYVIVSSEVYGRYLKESQRYKGETMIYGEIFTMPLVQEFKPDPAVKLSAIEFVNIPRLAGGLLKAFNPSHQLIVGPTIQIYRLPS